MNFGRCADCREYKHLVENGKCNSCIGEFPLDQSESTLILGSIGTGKTVTLQTGIHRYLQEDSSREVFILDTLDQHDDLNGCHTELALSVGNSCSVNPLSAVGHIGGDVGSIIDIILQEALGGSLSGTEKQMVRQSARSLSQPCTTNELFVDLQAQQQKRSPVSSNRKSQLAGVTASKLSEFSSSGRFAYLGAHRDPRLDNPNSITRLTVENPGSNTASVFAAFTSLYKEAVETPSESLIIVDAAHSQLSSRFGPLYSDAFRNIRGNTSMWIASQPDYSGVTGLEKEVENLAILAQTPERKLPFSIPSGHKKQLSKPAGKGHVVMNNGTRWLDAQVSLTDDEKNYFV